MSEQGRGRRPPSSADLQQQPSGADVPFLPGNSVDADRRWAQDRIANFFRANRSAPVMRKADDGANNGHPGPSGRTSTEKYLENSWDKATFGQVKKSVAYHVAKHAGGMDPVEYTQLALKAFDDPKAKKTKAVDIQGRPALAVTSVLGRGLFTPHRKIIWFHPK